MIDSRTLLSKITNEHVIKLMADHGSPVYSRTTDGGSGQECLWFRTICHGGDSHKLCYFTSTKTFYCYTSCGFMSFYDFVKKINHYDEHDFYSSLKFVAELVGESLNNKTGHGFLGMESEEDVADSTGINSFKSSRINARTIFNDKESIRKIEQEAALKVYDRRKYFCDYDFTTFYQGWIDEGISVETMKKFHIGWRWYGYYIVIPHFNINGDLIGVRKRTFDPDEIAFGGKYMPIRTCGDMLQHELGKNLYGIYENKQVINDKRYAVLVEGEKSVMLLDTYYNGQFPAVATCGFNISESQIRLLKSLHINDVYLAFDHDFYLDKSRDDRYGNDDNLKCNYNHYITKIKTIAEKLSKRFARVHIILDGYNGEETLLNEKDSPVDQGKEVFEKLFDNALDYKTRKYQLEGLYIK